MNASARVEALRREMAAAGVDVYIVPSADAHQSEYVPGAWQRRPWLSGFTGSAGDAAVGPDGAWQWADSRYWLQADAELDAGVWTAMKHGLDGVPSLVEWLAARPAGTRVGYDPRLVGVAQAAAMDKALKNAHGALVALDGNLVDAIWRDRPALPTAPIAPWPDEYAGVSVADKLARLREAMGARGATALAMTTLDEIAWAFNIRGADVAFNPVVVAYALVPVEGAATLFVDAVKVTPAVEAHLAAAGVRTAPYDAFGAALDALRGERVWIDRDSASRWVADRLEAAGAEVIAELSPAQLQRAAKNEVEQRGMRAAHVRDGVAVVRFLSWLETAWQGGDLDEIAASDRLERFRAEGERFLGLSFDTISGFGSNGAIVHYRATPKTAKIIDDSAPYLVDSGAQYLDGTTDITRTVHLGAPTAAQREHYTRVLRGHLQIGRATFPKGTTGTQLDALARTPLWEVGLNYGHGTGHGVGCYLSVHQGPHRVSPAPNAVGLEPGFILSNEPGFYLQGHYGIRIENLVVVVPRLPEKHGMGPFYGFDDLTMVPHCRNLIASELLSGVERAQVDAYHARVREALAPRLEGDALAWLERETAPL